MVQVKAESKKHSWIARHWGKATALALASSAFVGWYDAVRSGGPIFLCDAAALVGQTDSLPFCAEVEAPPHDGSLLAQLDFLEGLKDQLSAEQREQLATPVIEVVELRKGSYG